MTWVMFFLSLSFMSVFLSNGFCPTHRVQVSVRSSLDWLLVASHRPEQKFLLNYSEGDSEWERERPNEQNDLGTHAITWPQSSLHVPCTLIHLESDEVIQIRFSCSFPSLGWMRVMRESSGTDSALPARGWSMILSSILSCHFNSFIHFFIHSLSLSVLLSKLVLTQEVSYDFMKAQMLPTAF